MSKLIETPYGRKTPELLCKAMDAHVMLPDILYALKQAEGYIEEISHKVMGAEYKCITLAEIRKATRKIEEKQ